VSFAVLAWTGIYLRRRTAVHKRLIALATLAIIGPALARLSRLPAFGGEQSSFVLVVNLALVAAVIVDDVVTIRKIHLATALGVAFSLALLFAGTAIARPSRSRWFGGWSESELVLALQRDSN